MIVTKLQVDVLVQAAVLGPMEAEHWTPLVKDPDALGRDLMSSGRRSSGERNGEGYVFEPLPIAITAVEAIQACNYYQYNRSKTPAIVRRIMNEMIVWLEGYREAPWGWRSDDVAARLGRPGPRSTVPAPLPADLTRVADRLTEVGIVVDSLKPVVSTQVDYAVGGTGRCHGTIVATHVEEPPYREDGPNWRILSTLQVTVAKDAEAAERLFPFAVQGIVWDGFSRFTEVRRVDSIVIAATMPERTEERPEPELAACLQRLGEADQLWAHDEPALESGPGALIARTAEMNLTVPVVASDKPGLERLIASVPDPRLKEQLRHVDLRQHSVVATPNWEIGEVLGVELVRAATGLGPSQMTEDLVITVPPDDRPRPTTGSIILTPRLRRRPDYVRLTNPHRSSRFGGLWKDIGRLGRTSR